MANSQFQPDRRDLNTLSSRRPIKGFRGLNTVTDVFALDSSWLVRADNCVVTDKGKLERAEGYTLALACTAVTGAYATDDLQRLYLVDDGTLYQVFTDSSRSPLVTGLSSAPMRFTEVNGVVYYANGIDYGILEPAGALTWGIVPPSPITQLTVGAGLLNAGLYRIICTVVDARGQESGNSAVSSIEVDDGSLIVLSGIPQVSGYSTNVYATAQNESVFYLLRAGAPASLTYNVNRDGLGEEYPFLFANQPHGVLPAFFAGRMYLADPYPTLDMSVVWFSFPLHYHLFDDASEGVSVPGTVLMLQACDKALIIGTERAIYALDEDNKLTMLAPYGVLPGDHARRHEGSCFFWSMRGLCQALPFVNLTESTVSLAPGLSACGHIIERDGYKRFFVALNAGGGAYNALGRVALPD